MERDFLNTIKHAARAGGVLLLAACVMPGAALAQSTPAEKSEFRITPYLWVSGFQGTLGVPNGGGSGLPGTRVDAAFGKVLDNLEITGAGMLAVDWRRDKWSLFGDWTYVGLKSTVASPYGAVYAGVEGELKGNIGQAAVGYALLRDGDTRVDVYGGARYYDIDLQLNLQPGALTARSLSARKSWADGLIGVRFEGRLGGNWYETLQADVGAGGSDMSLQGIAAIAYRFSWGAITGGWRYLKADYEKDNFKYDAALSGPFIGATFRF
jgi:hypothetical protein